MQIDTTKMSLDDLHRSFGSTFIKNKDNNKILKVRHIINAHDDEYPELDGLWSEGSDDDPYFFWVTDDAGEGTYIPRSVVVPWHPVSGFYNYGRGVVHVERFSSVQWRLSYNANCFAVNMPFIFSSFMSYLYAENDSVSPLNTKLLDMYNNPTFFTSIEEAEMYLKELLRWGAAINHKYALVATPFSENPALYYNNKIVGYVENGTLLLNQSAYCLVEDLSQFGSVELFGG